MKGSSLGYVIGSCGIGRQGLRHFLCVRLRICGSHVMSHWFSQCSISTPVFYPDPNISVCVRQSEMWYVSNVPHSSDQLLIE